MYFMENRGFHKVAEIALKVILTLERKQKRKQKKIKCDPSEH